MLEQLRVAVAGRQLRALDAELVVSLMRIKPEPDVVVQTLTALVSYQYSRGHSCFDLSVWLKQPKELLGYRELPLWLVEVMGDYSVAELVTRLQQSPWCSSDGTAPLTLVGDKLYLTRLYHAEQTIQTAILQRLSWQENDEQVMALVPLVKRFFPESAGAAINWQKLACAMAALQRFSIITGGPGTGKTTTVVRLLAILQEQAQGQLTIALAAPTGKAAARLQESIGQALEHLATTFKDKIPTQVSTLHRLLGGQMGKRSFRYQRNNPLPADVVIVDEASMVDAEMMAALLRAVKPNARLVLLGDKDQLASVEAGSVLADLCEGATAAGYQPAVLAYLSQFTSADLSSYAGAGSAYNQATVMLRHSYRFGADSGIGELARAVNAGRTELTPIFQHFQDVQWQQCTFSDTKIRALVIAGYQPLFTLLQQGLKQENPTDEDINAWAKQVLQQQRAFQVLCAVRNGPTGVHAINEQMAIWFEQAGFITAHRLWYEGRAVMIEENNYSLNLMNGDVGIALRHPQSQELRVVFETAEGKLRWILPARLNQVSTVYAMTVHKSQGSEFTHTMLVLPNEIQTLLTRELLYTAITRASQRFTLVAEQAAVVKQMCRQRVQRSSGL